MEELLTWYRRDMEVKKFMEKVETSTQEMREQMRELSRKLTVLTESPREGGQLSFFFVCFRYYMIIK